MVKPNEKMKEKTGSPYYIAPEVLTGKYDEKCDIWSCGVILYILVTGEPPFGGDNNEEIFAKIKKGRYNMKVKGFESVSVELKDMIKIMLQLKPEDRPTANELLKHEWLKKGEKKVEGELKNNVISNLQRLKSFNADLKMQQAVLSFIASQMTGQEEQEKLRQSFEKLDKNGVKNLFYFFKFFYFEI